MNLPTDLPRTFRYQLRHNLFAGTWRVSYELVGEHGGAVLNVSGPHHYDGRNNWSAGLEFHWRLPPDYMRGQPPSDDKCYLLKCPCWHDGTSLYAQEHYLPMVLRGDHASVFRRMADDAAERLITTSSSSS